MEKISIVGLDLAKNTIQLHAACADGSVSKARLGKTSKMGQRDLRRLLINGAATVVRWAIRRGCPEGSWLSRMIGRKPPMVVIVALANRMARIAWALMTKGGRYEIAAA